MTRPLSILVVDDNTAMVKTTADILSAKGYQVHAAHSGSMALGVLATERVDILLTDVIMPEMNGVELNRHARELYPNLYSIFMTAHSADALIQQGIADGVSTVLAKPLDINFLLHLIAAADVSYFHPAEARAGNGTDGGGDP